MLQTDTDNVPARLPSVSYDGNPLYSGFSTPIRLRDRLFAFLRVAEMATYVLGNALWQRLQKVGRLRPDESESSRQFARDGIVVNRLSPQARNSVLDAARPFFERLNLGRSRSPRGTRSYGDNQLDLRRSDAAELFGTLEKVLSDTGTLPAVRRYLDCCAQIRKVTLQINDEWDTYWRKHFEERGLEIPSTAFFHVDNTYGVIKVIFYASAVGVENGPFSYVIGTNRIRFGKLESVLLRATDIWLDMYPSERRLFFALPPSLRKKAKFGDDIPKDSEWGRWLLSREKVVTSLDGDIFTFDVQGIHRGGMVARGERRIIQIMIR
jgi:hypothetical protein